MEEHSNASNDDSAEEDAFIEMLLDALDNNDTPSTVDLERFHQHKKGSLGIDSNSSNSCQISPTTIWNGEGWYMANQRKMKEWNGTEWITVGSNSYRQAYHLCGTHHQNVGGYFRPPFNHPNMVINPGQHFWTDCDKQCCGRMPDDSVKDWVEAVASNGLTIFRTKMATDGPHLAYHVRGVNPKLRPKIDLNLLFQYAYPVRESVLFDAVIPTTADEKEQVFIDDLLRNPESFELTDSGKKFKSDRWRTHVEIWDSKIEQAKKKQRTEQRLTDWQHHLVFDLVCVYLLTEPKFIVTHMRLTWDYISEYIPWSMIVRYMDPQLFDHYTQWVSAAHIGGFNLMVKYNFWMDMEEDPAAITPYVASLEYYSKNMGSRMIFKVDVQCQNKWVNEICGEYSGMFK